MLLGASIYLDNISHTMFDINQKLFAIPKKKGDGGEWKEGKRKGEDKNDLAEKKEKKKEYLDGKFDYFSYQIKI